MWRTKSRFVDVFISKIGWNPGNEFGKDTEKNSALKNNSIVVECLYFDLDEISVLLTWDTLNIVRHERAFK